MDVETNQMREPFFSICIPQHNRTAFLIEACRSLANQTFRDFEVCISDDCSTDGKEGELIAFLEQSGLKYVYHRQEQNLRYDGNLRASISLSQGKYCFLLGNDDALQSGTTLQEIHDDIERLGPAAVVITNFQDFRTGKKVLRVKDTKLQGSGPVVAANNFRNVSFVSGVLLDGPRARALTTDKWDGSEMYQMYLTCRLIAEGGQLLTINKIAIRKDIPILGESIDSYAAKGRLNPCPIVERRLTYHLIGPLVVDAIEPYTTKHEKQRLAERVLYQLLILTYPFWLFEYRRVQSWKYAFGIYLGIRPRNLVKGMNLSVFRTWRIRAVYLVVGLLGLTLPVGLFFKVYPQLHALAKSRFAQLAHLQFGNT
jgi:glycosyltransferase involved in cell wall biosynthesis